MAKTNYTKVEEALNEGLRRMSVNNLLDISAQVGKPEMANEPADQLTDKQLIAALQFEVRHCKDPLYFKAGRIRRQTVKGLIEHSDTLTADEWLLLRAFYAKAEEYKKAAASQQPADFNEKLVEQERKKHINKRYNTKEQWLPLH